MFVRVLICVCLAALAAFLADPAAAERRVALVIGNSTYAKVPKLANPINDSGAIEALLEAAGFDKVVRADNLGAAQMRRALRDFSDEVRDADIAVVFYAGHGMEMNGTNYLIPVDAVLERDIDVADETVSLDRINQVLEQAKRLRLVILDACRDNPFVRSMRRTLAGRAIGRGLAPVEVASTDTLIAYAAKAGSTAADGEGTNSPYTSAMLKHLATPGLDIRLALGRVRDEVLRTTSRRQEPFVYGSLGGAEVTLVPKPAEVAPAAAPSAGPTGPLTYQRYVESFEAGQPILRDNPFNQSEMGRLSFSILDSAIAKLKGTKWQGGTGWGNVTFDDTGQRATYTNDSGGTPGRMLLSGVFGDAGNYQGSTRSAVIEPILIGEWYQQDGRGGFILKFERDQLKMLWGPRFLRESVLKRQDLALAWPKSTPPTAGSDAVAALAPGSGRSARDCQECPEMVVVPAGSFAMGSNEHDREKPLRTVTIRQPFAVGKFEVTFAEWKACVVGGGCQNNKSPDDKGWGKNRRPVINVSWDDAKQYATWLSHKTGKAYRLLTEAQWEYAAKANVRGKYAFGDAISPNQARYSVGQLWSAGSTVEVGQFSPNPWGLHDMHGNVWEWCEDYWHPSYQDAPADSAARLVGTSTNRVLRGGSWGSNPVSLRTTNRFSHRPDLRNYDVGFRVARDL